MTFAATTSAGLTPLERDQAIHSPRVVDWDTLLALCKRWRSQGKIVVWTNGCFDLLHSGHLQSLRAARALGDLLVVGINSDESVRRLKGAARPILPAHQRAQILAALRCVDYVIVFDELTPQRALARLKPDVHCKGADYAPPHGMPIPEAATVASYGGRIEFLPLVDSISTSRIIEHIWNLKKFEKGTQLICAKHPPGPAGK